LIDAIFEILGIELQSLGFDLGLEAWSLGLGSEN